MKIQSASFVKSALTLQQCPQDGRPEVAFAGRSNVGKSTLLNVLLNRKGLAKTSKKPGKTQTLNFFDVNNRFYFVDLPGYGFAKVSKQLRDTWGQALTAYLSQRKTLRLVVHLLDARHDPTDNDTQLLDLLDAAKVPTVLVATKFDKVNGSERADALNSLRKALSLDDEALIIPFSATTKEGLGPLWRVLDDALLSPQSK